MKSTCPDSTVGSAVRAALPLSVVLLASEASAQVVYTNPADLTTTAGGAVIGFNPLNQSASLGTNQGGIGDFTLSFQINDATKPQIGTNSSHYFVASVGDSLDRLALGTTIDASNVGTSTLAIINRNAGNDAQWAAGSSGYFGFSIINGADTFYGWAQLTYGSDKSLTLHDFAYESTPGAAITAGATTSAIPEPSTYAAMAGLLAGSAVLLRRRQQRLAKTA